MKGYYLFAPVEPENVGPDSGVERKVRAQCKALNQYLDCELVILPPVQYTGRIAERIIRRLPYTAAWRKWKYKGEFDDADFVYIRQVYHDRSFLRYLKKIRRHNPHVKLLYEVPTFPFERSSKRSKWLPNPFALKRNKSLLPIFAQMDRVITFYGQEQILGVPCIPLINGLDFSMVTLPSRTVEGAVVMLSVSATGYWHGYDRLIEGIHLYYANGGTENIVYHVVGNVLPELRKMAQDYKLEDHVVFHGRLSGQPLQELYGQCLLGVDVLGGHRKKYPISSSLKSREYGAYGLPILTSSPVDYLETDSPYQCVLPYDDSPIDMDAVLRYFHSLYDNMDCNELAKQIRTNAAEKCAMEQTVQPLIRWLRENVPENKT